MGQLATKIFSNGSDAEVVAELYLNTFEWGLKATKKQTLTSIDFVGTMLDDYFEALSQFDQLQEFQMTWCDFGRESGFHELIAVLAQLPKLENVSICNCGVS